MIPGLYGKMPAHGDFVRRNLPEGFVSPWDGWAQAGLAAAQAGWNGDWARAWEDAPPWRFALPAGACGPAPVAGVMVTSADTVGRRFPLVLAAILEGPAPAAPPVAVADDLLASILGPPAEGARTAPPPGTAEEPGPVGAPVLPWGDPPPPPGKDGLPALPWDDAPAPPGGAAPASAGEGDAASLAIPGAAWFEALEALAGEAREGRRDADALAGALALTPPVPPAPGEPPEAPGWWNRDSAWPIASLPPSREFHFLLARGEDP